MHSYIVYILINFTILNLSIFRKNISVYYYLMKFNKNIILGNYQELVVVLC